MITGLPDDFWEWLEMGDDDQKDEALMIIFSDYIRKNQPGDVVYIPPFFVKPIPPPKEKKDQLPENFEKDYIKYLNKKLKEGEK